MVTIYSLKTIIRGLSLETVSFTLLSPLPPLFSLLFRLLFYICHFFFYFPQFICLVFSSFPSLFFPFCYLYYSKFLLLRFSFFPYLSSFIFPFFDYIFFRILVASCPSPKNFDFFLFLQSFYINNEHKLVKTGE